MPGIKPKADFENKSSCPYCGHLMDTGQTPPSDPDQDAVPKAGDYGMCIECGGFLVYTDNAGSLRKMTPKDAAAEPQILETLTNMRAHLRDMKR